MTMVPSVVVEADELLIPSVRDWTPAITLKCQETRSAGRSHGKPDPWTAGHGPWDSTDP
jgi:hypothetical protein